MHRPNGVARGSSLIAWIAPHSASASTIIDLNFSARKILPPSPTRS
jgi:hypothetical protein